MSEDQPTGRKMPPITPRKRDDWDRKDSTDRGWKRILAAVFVVLFVIAFLWVLAIIFGWLPGPSL